MDLNILTPPAETPRTFPSRVSTTGDAVPAPYAALRVDRPANAAPAGREFLNRSRRLNGFMSVSPLDPQSRPGKLQSNLNYSGPAWPRTAPGSTLGGVQLPFWLPGHHQLYSVAVGI